MAVRNVERSSLAIRFLENLIVPSGVGTGRNLKLRDWQRRFIRDLYEPTRAGGKRRVRRAILSIARKNGKSALIAAIALLHLVGPEAIMNGEIYSAANERDQAAVVFKFACQMVRADPELSALIKIVYSTKTMVCHDNGSVYRALSAQAGSKHGLNPSVVIYDELAQAKKRDLFDVLDTGFGAREEPLLVVISTQSNDPQHILSQMIDDGLSKRDRSILVHLYAVPDDADIWDESCWHEANPALGDFRDMDEMRRYAERARRVPSFEPSFRNLYLNQRINIHSPMVAQAEWKECADRARELPDGARVYLGLDLSSTTDLTAMVAVSADGGDVVRAWTWKPGDLLAEHSERDRAPYDLWVRQGWIAAPPGRTVDYGAVALKIADLTSTYDVVALAYDRWRIEILLRELSQIGVDAYVDGKEDDREGALRLVPFGQGFRDMAPAVDALETAVLNRTLAHDGNPVLQFCMLNAHAVMDAAGNRKLDKSATRFRIDAAVALTIAIGCKARDLAGETIDGPSIYEILAARRAAEMATAR